MPRKDPIPTSLLETPLTRRTVLEAFGAFGVSGLFLAGCTAGTTETPKASPSEANAPSTPEKPIPKDIYNASWEEIKPLTQAELYPQDNPHFLPDYIMGANTSDDGHLNEIPELFAINLDPSDYDTDKEFVDALVEEWLARYNGLIQIGTSGRGDGLGSDRSRLEKAAVKIYYAMSGDRKDASVPSGIVDRIMSSGNCKNVYNLAEARGQQPQYPLAVAAILDKKSVKFTGTRDQGIESVTFTTRLVRKADQRLIWQEIGPAPSMAEIDAKQPITLSDVKISSSGRVSSKLTTGDAINTQV